jgi:hypothetical protein
MITCASPQIWLEKNNGLYEKNLHFTKTWPLYYVEGKRASEWNGGTVKKWNGIGTAILENPCTRELSNKKLPQFKRQPDIIRVGYCYLSRIIFFIAAVEGVFSLMK